MCAIVKKMTRGSKENSREKTLSKLAVSFTSPQLTSKSWEYSHYAIKLLEPNILEKHMQITFTVPLSDVTRLKERH